MRLFVVFLCESSRRVWVFDSDSIKQGYIHIRQAWALMIDTSPKIILFHNQSYLFVELDTVVFLEADGNYTNLFFTDDTRITSSKVLKSFESWIDLGNFVRVSRKHIVNVDKIEKILTNEGPVLLMEGGLKIQISRRKLGVLLKQLFIV